MSNKNKSVEEMLETLTWYQINEAVDEIERGVRYVNLDELRTLLQQEHQTSQERERKNEAYLWFENWYSYYKAPLTAESNQNFGKWATERLQTLGVHEPEVITNPNKD